MTSIVEKSTFRSAPSGATKSSRRPGQQSERAHGVVWSEMVQGVWVAKRNSDFAGLIEELWGAGYRVTDRTGAIVGEFSTLQSARRQIE